MLCHSVPSVWRGLGLTVVTVDGTEVTLPNHIIEMHVDPFVRMHQLDAVPLFRTPGVVPVSNTTLFVAAAAGALWDVQRLLRAGAPLLVPGDCAGALGWAAGHGQLAAVELLLRAGASPAAHDNVALLWAAGRNHVDVVCRLLREPGVNRTARSCWAERWARQRGHAAVLAVL